MKREFTKEELLQRWRERYITYRTTLELDSWEGEVLIERGHVMAVPLDLKKEETCYLGKGKLKYPFNHFKEYDIFFLCRRSSIKWRLFRRAMTLLRRRRYVELSLLGEVVVFWHNTASILVAPLIVPQYVWNRMYLLEEIVEGELAENVETWRTLTKISRGGE